MLGHPADGIYNGGAVAVWLERPNVLVTQVRSPRYTVEQAKTFVSTILPRARATFGAERLIWVSDSRIIESYESGARAILTDWCVEHKRELERVLIMVSAKSRLTLMGLRVATLAAATAGIRMDVLTALDELRRACPPVGSLLDES